MTPTDFQYPISRATIDRLYIFSKYAVVAGFLGAILTALGGLIWLVARSNFSEFPQITRHLITGLLEPTTTKLIPAIAILAYTRKFDRITNQFISENTLILAILFGFLIGSLEFFLYILRAVMYSLFIPVPLTEAIACRLPPILLHTVTGTIVSLPILSLADYDIRNNQQLRVSIFSEQFPLLKSRNMNRLFLNISLGSLLLIVAQVLHVWWNTGGNEIIAQILRIPC